MPPDTHCRYCDQLLEFCREPVDHRFPLAAQMAYKEAGYTHAAKCPEGQRRDMTRVGWCIDRAVRHPGWSGAVPPGVTIQTRRSTA